MRSLLSSVATLVLGGTLLVHAACGADERASNQESPDGGSSISSTSGATSTSSSSSSSSGTSTLPGLPAGCNDNASFARFLVVDGRKIRITSLQATSVAQLCAGGGERPDCSHTVYTAELTIPDTTQAGAWMLPHPDVTLTVLQTHPFTVSDAGCVCTDADTTPHALTSGRVTWTLRPDDPDYPAAIELENVGGVFGEGMIGALVQRCPAAS